MKKRFMMILMVALLLPAAQMLSATANLGGYTNTAATLELAATAATSSNEEVARQLIEAVEGSRALVNGTMRDVVAMGYVLPSEANAQLAQGETELQEAKNRYAEGLYTESAEAAQRAMRILGNALTLVLKIHEYEYPTNSADMLTHRIEKLNDKVDQISDLLEGFSPDDENLVELNELLVSAKKNLELATSKVSDGSLDEAESAIVTAQKDLQDLTQNIGFHLNKYREELMQQFTNRLRERVDASLNDINALEGQIQTENMSSATQRLGEANGLIIRAENELQQGLNENAFDDLTEASIQHNRGMEAVGRDDITQGLMSLNMIRCQVQVQQGIAERLRRMSQDTSSIDAQIQELQGLIEEGRRMMARGDYSGANGLFQNAEQSGKYYGSGKGSGTSGQGGSGSGKGSGG